MAMGERAYMWRALREELQEMILLTSLVGGLSALAVELAVALVAV